MIRLTNVTQVTMNSVMASLTKGVHMRTAKS
jgi:hypothetical protein